MTFKCKMFRVVLLLEVVILHSLLHVYIFPATNVDVVHIRESHTQYLLCLVCI